MGTSAVAAQPWAELSTPQATFYSLAPTPVCAQQVAQGQGWQGLPQPMQQYYTVEDLLAIVQRLPTGTSAVAAVAPGLGSLDSRACAALLKELSKSGLPHHALGIFDWLQSLPTGHELSRLCDIFTYTTGEYVDYKVEDKGAAAAAIAAAANAAAVAIAVADADVAVVHATSGLPLSNT